MERVKERAPAEGRDGLNHAVRTSDSCALTFWLSESSQRMKMKINAREKRRKETNEKHRC